MPSDLEQLAFETAQRGIDRQDEVLRELRARTGTLLAASSIATSFLGSQALDDGGRSALLIAALVAFGVTIAASVYTLIPRTDQFVFSLGGSSVYERFYALREEMPEVYRRLAYDLDRFWDENDLHLARLFRAYRLGAIALLVEVVLLAGLVTGTLG